jgi:histidyl-tRNA synthetase
LIQEIEILNLLIEVLESLIGKNTFTININSREILFEFLNKLNIDVSKYDDDCATMGKLDKLGNDVINYLLSINN